MFRERPQTPANVCGREPKRAANTVHPLKNKNPSLRIREQVIGFHLLYETEDFADQLSFVA